MKDLTAGTGLTTPSPRVVSVDGVPAQPWKNGGGQTRELLVWPTAEWILRVSVADIDRDGPFSSFIGLDRVFVVLEGGGVVLRSGDRDTLVRVGAPPLVFAGEDAPDCRLVQGSTRDLNAMTRRALATTLVAPVGSGPLIGRFAMRALFTAEPVVLHTGTSSPLGLAAMSLYVDDTGSADPWTVDGAARAWWIACSYTAHAASRPG